MACVIAAAACQREDAGQGASIAARIAQPTDALDWSVARARVVRHLGTSTLETRDAAPGEEFIVLDVWVRNAGAQPQVVSEGRLIAVGASRQQTFDTPVSMLANEYLTLQVLAPAASARGKIAFSVPRNFPGVFYWNPGNGTQRILLHLAHQPAVASTLADTGERIGSVPASPSDALADAPIGTPSAMMPRRTDTGSDTAATAANVTAARQPSKALATVARPPSARTTPDKVRARRAQHVVPVSQEQARRTACEALLSRNDAQAREASRPFYLLNCPDYPLPSNWSAPVVAAAVAPPRMRDGCGPDAPRAAQLVCRDPFLASLDRRLSASYARALEVVDDPGALQRNQQDWRDRIRNACSTIRCLELAYGRRTAHMDAVGRAAP